VPIFITSLFQQFNLSRTSQHLQEDQHAVTRRHPGIQSKTPAHRTAADAHAIAKREAGPLPAGALPGNGGRQRPAPSAR
jgi:hypothetical protein